MNDLLLEKYNFLNENEKKFIVSFNDEMAKIGYVNSGIQDYVVFGKYKIEYYKLGLKTKKIIARIYIRDGDEKIAARWGGNGLGIALRLYFTNINKHKTYIENAPDFIKTPFIDNHSICHDCKVNCNRKKVYMIDGKMYTKCTDCAFMFEKPNAENVMEYINLLKLFYLTKGVEK
ncbi:MAG: hypothetical protein FWH20_06635 [Oscillospiraceae bacterium]|nr:hypothetical protein [Oscillospiraceae bacterium]